MFRQMTMNPHPSKGYISTFQIVFKHYSSLRSCQRVHPYANFAENHKKSRFFVVSLILFCLVCVLPILSDCRFALKIISKNLNSSLGFISLSGGNFYVNFAENHKKSIFFLVLSIFVKLIGCFVNT